ncbi:Transmembrane transcriptional regulator (anti-sigma factor RsiW) [Pseudomonas reinekei]|uniref:Anti-sigma factor n=1 Tax=Pseudomonas reinekei TaxID=395598 RepID=A0A1H0I493_PSERE|nr:anti-sigma factor [Pseudomonas reinekei]KAB0486889.1 anti-sigma factor [Pseudomonas reinekei]OLU04117.1 anti-sigma factor [Pseudomonas reinekei]SDO26226.1 Transmembrane transcriptional regulator (anti-sigma factor RsiW) [Pseudomonas reinekei]
MTTVGDDALLLAYVNGELSPQQCQEIEQLMEHSPDVAERVFCLMASTLPYPEAFARQAIPPVPESLVQKIDALSKQSLPPRPDAQVSRKTHAPAASFVERMFGKPRLGWLAVAFATGAACYGLVLQAGFLGGAARTHNPVQPPTLAQNQPSPWVQQAASYQQLYTRDTVDLVTPDPGIVARTVSDIRQVDGLALRIPDLSSAGLTFKGVQRLRFNQKALVQLIYLPQTGAPIALCVMKEPKPDQSPAQLRVAQMNVVVWRQSELGYALIGEPEGVDLNAVARLVADRSAGQLFASRLTPLWIAATRE